MERNEKLDVWFKKKFALHEENYFITKDFHKAAEASREVFGKSKDCIKVRLKLSYGWMEPRESGWTTISIDNPTSLRSIEWQASCCLWNWITGSSLVLYADDLHICKAYPGFKVIKGSAVFVVNYPVKDKVTDKSIVKL